MSTQDLNSEESSTSAIMKVEELFIYPIKSLRGSSIQRAEVVKTGFKYDRTFMLLKVEDSGFKNMLVSAFPEMCLFCTEICLPDMASSEKTPGHIVVSHMDPENPSAPNRRLHVPLEPSTEALELLNVDMHQSKTVCYAMPSNYSDWFSSCFGYPVVLAYIGQFQRPVLGNLPSARSSFSDLKAKDANPPSFFVVFWLYLFNFFTDLLSKKPKETGITFSDCAALLTVTTASLADVSRRLPLADQPADITKFRPNILVSSPCLKAWEEDFWSGISVTNPGTKQKVGVELTGNCGRCVSLNVDYRTGKFVGEESVVLKRLMKDRRIDTGTKYTPIFGRYGFPMNGGIICVGDEVKVTGRNEEHTVWSWPGLG